MLTGSTNLIGSDQPMGDHPYINHHHPRSLQSGFSSGQDSIMISKHLLMARLKRKVSTFLKHQKRKLKKTEDLEEYVDFTWEFRTRSNNLVEVLSVLPYHDVLGDWLDKMPGDPCDLSACVGDCQSEQENYYATVFSQELLQES